MTGSPVRGRRGRVLAGGLSLAVASGVLAACGGDAAGGTPVVTWYINPDAGGQQAIADACSEQSGGAYRISVQTLPRDAPGQREQLLRRLAANDDTIDLMSLDPPFVPEFAQAGFLADVPDDVEQAVTQDVLDGALQGATFDDELVTVPFWANTQILWFKESVAEAAGLDMSQPVTWDQVIEAAQQQDTQIAVQGTLAESLMVWVNALVESAGGSVLEDPAAPVEDLTPTLDSEAGRAAAQVLASIGEAGVGGPQFTNATEDINASSFESGAASFMVNYPFVWPRAQGVLDEAALDDIGYALYPQVTSDEVAAPPLGGINLGVSALSQNVDLAYEIAQCIVTPENQAEYFVTNGNPPSNSTAFDDPDVQETFPMADVIRESLDNAAPRPQTAYYNVVSESVQREWHPPGGVDPERTPRATDDLITAVLNNEALL